MASVDVDREKVLQDYRKKLLEHKEVESRLKESEYPVSLPPNCQIMVIVHFSVSL